uniref:Secreted protein n=1 Tax=Knipowitschia caucasica TaxID=637954 RepID=A0AAV2L6C0_KNICA
MARLNWCLAAVISWGKFLFACFFPLRGAKKDKHAVLQPPVSSHPRQPPPTNSSPPTPLPQLLISTPALNPSKLTPVALPSIPHT